MEAELGLPHFQIYFLSGNARLSKFIVDYNTDGKMDFLVATDTATNLRNYDMYYGENGLSFSI
jgi:hypothetical protein